MILSERRRAGFDPRMVRRMAAVWLALSLLLLMVNAMAVWAWRFPDPDDTLRLIQVRDLLAGQSWFDLHQYRVAPPEGVPMHWSRLVDIPLLLVIAPLAPLVGQAAAETTALILVPLLTLFALLLLIGRMAWKLFDEEIAGLAGLVCGMAVPVMHQFRPMRIDHHGWQIVAAALALNALMARDAKTGGRVLGLALAGWLAISIEGLPLAAAFVGIVALKWLRDPRQRAWLVHTLRSLAAGSLAIHLATRGLDLAPWCDQIAPAHLAVFAWGALAATGLAAFGPLPRATLLAGFGLIGAGAVGVLWAIAPQCASPDAFAGLDPTVRALWYEQVDEGLPIWRQDASSAVQIVLLPLLGLVTALRLAGQSRDWLRQWWFDYALLLAAALLVALLVARAAAVACVFAALPLSWQLRAWLRGLRRASPRRKRAVALAAFALALAPAVPLYLLTSSSPTRARAPADAPRVSQCAISDRVAMLRDAPPATILAPLDIGPRLILETPQRIVATGHHRGEAGMRDVIAAFTGTEAEAHAIVRRRDVTWVVLCNDLAEPQLYAALAPDGLAARLIRGDAPAWLRQVPVPGGGEFTVWRVVRPSA